MDSSPSIFKEMNDPHNLHERFVRNQKALFQSALVEIRQGEKRGCWLWFVLPTAPYVINGVERGSSMNRHFALRGDDCVRAYLQFQDKTLGVNLRTNYMEIVRAIAMQLRGGNTLSHIFGPMDDVKVISSLKLFERIALEMKDRELANLCRGVLEMSVSSRSSGFRFMKSFKRSGSR
mmetsp:Transcript_3265/g.6152  ORF Transcript_3265/g.6152 Transcript_3265/m.6152 type:complete len:177 (-) Transcript_3265:1973-2503(-)